MNSKSREPKNSSFAVSKRSDCISRSSTSCELAELLAVSPKTLYSYVSRNMIPHYKIEANVRFRGRTWPSGYAGEPHEHIESTLFSRNP